MKSCVKILAIIAAMLCVAHESTVAQKEVSIMAFDSIDYKFDTSISLPPIMISQGIIDGRNYRKLIPGKIIGNHLYLEEQLSIPSSWARKYARVTLQPYLVNRKTQDTTFIQPWIAKGKKFDLDKDIRNVLLPVNKIRKKFTCSKPLVGEPFSIHWTDTIYLVNPQTDYEVRCLMTIENVRRIIEQKDMLFAKHIYRPLRLLEYKPLLENIQGLNAGEAAVVKQISGLLEAHNYSKAESLSNLLPDKSELQIVKAFIYYLCGNYEKDRIGETKKCKEAFELIKATSPVNCVIVSLAMRSPHYDKIAWEVAEQLPATAVGLYLKSILYYQIYGLDLEMGPERYLAQAFRMDKQLIEIAACDIDINEELYEWAMEIYQK